MESSYYYYEYSPELGGRKLNTKIYSDTTVSLLELAQKEGLPSSPTLASMDPRFRTELSKSWLITTNVVQQQVNRIVHFGDFTFSGFQMTGGTIRESILVLNDGTIMGRIFSTPISYREMASVGAYKVISTYSGQPITLLGNFSQFFPSGWSDNPFGQNLVSLISAPIPVANTSTTTPSPDTLTGVAKQKDLFQLSAPPGFGSNIDKITNFSAKDKDSLQFSISAFGTTAGKFAIAKNPKKLAKLLSSDTNFIYNQKSGELIFNDNGPEPGFGIDGGIFAVLEGHPKLLGSSVSFLA